MTPSAYSRIEQIHTLLEEHGEETFVATGLEVFTEWRNTTRKDGTSTYDPANYGWIDKLQSRLMGGTSAPAKSTRDMTQAEYREHKQAEARRLGLEVDKLARKMGVEK